MKLRSLQLHGFKSFPDRTGFDFREGLTAIVGSNGCGKSNIADAIRWVLGEQRASALRSSRMDEVIFQGTVRRRPLQLAEVTLLFSNEDGAVPIPQSEIEVARKVFREGGSDYSLNRTPCRLRDVLDLLRDTGLGANAYSVIEVGMVEDILSDRAEERRGLLEEAAGIGKYKDRRRSALLRLEGAESDLGRLRDLISEVDSKVRSLARQRGKAQRHADYRRRKLSLEVAVLRAESERLEELVAGVSERLEALRIEAEHARASASTAETVLEEHRSGQVKLGHERVAAAKRLERVREQIEHRERERLLAGERGSHARERLRRLAGEKEALARGLSAAEADSERLAGEGELAGLALAEASRLLKLRRAQNDKSREELEKERARLAGLEARQREVTQEYARAAAEQSAAGARREDVRERLTGQKAAQDRLRAELSSWDEQSQLLAGEREQAQVQMEAADAALAEAREELDAARAGEAGAREELRAAEDLLSRLSSQASALELQERSYEGFSPAVSELLAGRKRFPGALAPLADFIPEPGSEQAARMERYLGPYLQAVVVRDLETARAIRRWFREEYSGEGILTLLPLDAPGLPRDGGGPTASGSGEGGAWVSRLVGETDLSAAGDPLDGHSAGLGRVGEGGEVVTPLGAIRLSRPGSGEGLLARRDRLAKVRGQVDQAGREQARLSARRERQAEALAAAEARLDQAGRGRQDVAEELRRVASACAEQEHARSRSQQDLADLAARAEQLRAAAREAEARSVELNAALERLSSESEALDAKGEAARASLAERERAWEEAREEESGLQLELVRSEAGSGELERRLEAAGREADRLREELAKAAEEEHGLGALLEQLAEGESSSGDEMERLFEQRDRETTAVAELDSRLAEVEQETARLEHEARAARRSESERAEQRHLIELERAEHASRLERVRERVEVEWGRPWEQLVAEAVPAGEGGVEEWREEAAGLDRKIGALGPINMLAVEEHEEESRRLDFLTEQRRDLEQARDHLTTAVREINRTARELFEQTFASVRENFHRTFDSLFPGGECDLWLADSGDPLESPVHVHASPRGKKTQQLAQLSGGERALTALALLFALYLAKPSPFCVLDEVDAPLDEANVGRFIRLLEEFKRETQFIVITHNPRTMEAADWIYGVTMEEPGVSSVVAVELSGAV
ncbi:MAG: chromosome segregation protein SMC [Longimicrobiaceae bacterium]